MSVRVVKDTGGAGVKAIAKRLRAGRHAVLVGIPAGKTEADGTSLALVAASNEFGVPSKNIPERPAFRRGIQRHRDQFRELNKRTLPMVADGRMTEEHALGLLGQAGAAAIKQEITEGNFAPNAPGTIRRKGSDKPLINSGALRQGITYVLDPDGRRAGPGIVR